jgi:hypothetical protein
MTIISMPGLSELIILAVVIGYWCLIIGTAISILRRTDITLPSRLLWVIILLIAPLIGLLLYHFFGQSPTSKA